MGLPDWSRPKILLALLAVTVPILVLIAINKADSSSAPPQQEASADCRRVDQAVRHWSDALPAIQFGLTRSADPAAIVRDSATAAAAVRSDAAAITDMTLRNKVTALADKLDMVRRGKPSAPPDWRPDQTYMDGYHPMTTLVHQLKVACPNVGNDPAPAGPPALPTN
ncbi:hypothetical protein MTY66_48220 [Mycolicibacterium sp. TY66]|uniref:hypothetical protein n=1 Tax=unclassified Mycolicibacterium TaxID=2636767 RepID=UPI001BB433E7|nr:MULTISPECIES: hypothetical protein [unclassified Mycolicibacterium]BCI83197.1 hypothetical protein MTY66_48220 [Mycolicibacterium sp. TY66]BCJ79157.1 hypothetical protein MTY81_05300 [Mycolicibacterium sp. TY81]